MPWERCLLLRILCIFARACSFHLKKAWRAGCSHSPLFPASFRKEFPSPMGLRGPQGKGLLGIFNFNPRGHHCRLPREWESFNLREAVYT